MVLVRQASVRACEAREKAAACGSLTAKIVKVAHCTEPELQVRINGGSRVLVQNSPRAPHVVYDSAQTGTLRLGEGEEGGEGR